MNNNIFPVPKELLNSFFFDEKTICWKLEDNHCFNPKRLFLYEAVFYAGKQSIKPWEGGAEVVSAVLGEWNEIRAQLQNLFSRRDITAAREPMKKGIGIFIELVHWANGVPVQLSPVIQYDQFSIKPVNLQERLDFILARPFFFPSYIQLTELIIEMEKLYKKSIAMKKSV